MKQKIILKIKTPKDNTVSFHHTSIIITFFFAHNFLYASEFPAIHSGQPEYAPFFQQLKTQNAALGKLDSILLKQHFLKKFTDTNAEEACCLLYDKIIQHKFVLNLGKQIAHNPFRLKFQSKKGTRFSNQINFISNNKLNRKFSKDHPEKIPVDHCSYLFKSDKDTRPYIMCCFFNREIVLKALMNFIRTYNPSPSLNSD